MRKQDLVIGLIVLDACVPRIDRDDPGGRHYSGAEWLLDRNGNVVATRSVLVERSDGGHGRVIGAGVGNDDIALSGSLRGGVLRVVEVRSTGRRVIDLTPVRDDDFDERVRALEVANAAPR